MKKSIIFLFLCLLTVAAAQAENPFWRLPWAQFAQPSGSSKDGWYLQDWARLTVLDDNDKYKEAHELATKIYDRAKADGNQPQMLKALWYVLEFNKHLEKRSAMINRLRLEQELATAPFPMEALLHAWLGDLLLDMHGTLLRYNPSNGSLADSDWTHWPADTLWIMGMQHLEASIVPVNELQQIRCASFGPFLKVWGDLHGANNLYDLLAWRALDNLREASFDDPRRDKWDDPFLLQDTAVFASDLAFVQHRFGKGQTRSARLASLQIFQRFTDVHLRDADKAVLIAIGSRRLQFAETFYLGVDRKALIYSAYQSACQTYSAHDLKLRYAQSLFECLDKMQDSTWQRIGDPTLGRRKRIEQVLSTAIASHPEAENVKRMRNQLTSLFARRARIALHPLLSPGEDIAVDLSYANCDSVWVRIVHRPPHVGKGYWDLHTLRHLPHVRDTLVLVQQFDDHILHHKPLKFAGLEQGEYVFLVSTNAKFNPKISAVSSSGFEVGSFEWISLHHRDHRKELLALDRRSGQPIAGFEVAYGRHRRAMAARNTFFSDFWGRVSVPESIYKQRARYLSLQRGEEVHVKRRKKVFDYISSRVSKVDTLTLIFTDRALYRPGQVIHFKAIMVRDSLGEQQVISGFKTSISLKSPTRDILYTGQFQTDAFGSFSGLISLPQRSLNGKLTQVSHLKTMQFEG